MLRRVGTPWVDVTPLLLRLLEYAGMPVVKAKPLRATVYCEGERQTLRVVPTLRKAVTTSREGLYLDFSPVGIGKVAHKALQPSLLPPDVVVTRCCGQEVQHVRSPSLEALTTGLATGSEGQAAFRAHSPCRGETTVVLAKAVTTRRDDKALTAHAPIPWKPPRS